MKTITKKTSNVKSKRETANRRTRKGSMSAEKSKHFLLKQNDYADLMEIKAIKAKRNADKLSLLVKQGYC